MHYIENTGLITVVVSLINTVVNLYWLVKFKAVQGNAAIIQNLKETRDELLLENDQLRQKKNQYKVQYHALYRDFQKAEAENRAYKRFHKHIDGEPQIPIATT